MTLRTLNYGNYGIFLIMGNAGFCPSAVWDLNYLFRVEALEMSRLPSPPVQREPTQA